MNTRVETSTVLTFDPRELAERLGFHLNDTTTVYVRASDHRVLLTITDVTDDA